MKDSGWINIDNVDASHVELLEDFTAVLYEMGISVSYNYVDDEGNRVYKLDYGVGVKIEIERSKNE
tara:strand:+ start:96 stop:293 length:198 start_codon:yes stop_codon:yes gene_type:complete